MPTVGEIAHVLEQLAPLSLAEEWDNVGLLVGDAQWPADRVMTCLTITPETVAEAIAGRAQLIVSHHPLPFRPVKSITSATTPGRLLLELIRASIAVYSPHTAFDSASAGINQHLAIGLGLQEIRPLVPSPADPEVGAGRCGLVGEPLTLDELAERTREFLERRNGAHHRAGRPPAFARGHRLRQRRLALGLGPRRRLRRARHGRAHVPCLPGSAKPAT